MKLYIPQSFEIPEKVPLLPLRGIVVFPSMMLPLFVGREKSINAVEAAIAGQRMIFLASQKEIEVENPSPSEMYPVGTVCVLWRMQKLPDGRMKVLVQGVARAKTVKIMQQEPFNQVEIEVFPDVPAPDSLETEALMRNVKERIERLTSLGRVGLPDIKDIIEDKDDPGKFADQIVASMGLKVRQAQVFLELVDPVQRLKRLNEALGNEIELMQR